MKVNSFEISNARCPDPAGDFGYFSRRGKPPGSCSQAAFPFEAGAVRGGEGLTRHLGAYNKPVPQESTKETDLFEKEVGNEKGSCSSPEAHSFEDVASIAKEFENKLENL